MASVEQEIRNWLHQQQDWIQEAVEKLLASGSLEDNDIQAISDRLKTPDGQQITTHRNFEGIGNSSSSTTDVHLLSIGDICGIENLCPHRPLTFGTGNLAVIYGPNGSGKSGYTRILNRVCGKPRAKEIKPNVFDSRPANQQCRIRYAIGEEYQSVIWRPSDIALEDLRAVDIFDADAAAFYISEEKAVSYMPQAVTMFEALASVCDRVKEKLQFEKSRLVSQLPNLPPEYRSTPPGKTYTQLKHDLTEQQIQCLTKWGDDNEEKLGKLTERLSADDPVKLAKIKRSTISQLEQLESQLTNAAEATGKQQVEALRTARENASQKRKIAEEATNLSKPS